MIHPDTTLGGLALSVSNLTHSVEFYQHRIGLALLAQEGDGATLGVGATPLLHLHEQPGARHFRRATGLFHLALRVPTRRDLARVIQHFAQRGTPLDGASDHGFSEALYLSDPDGHGIEVYRDRPRDTWLDARGNLRGVTDPLDIRSILSELVGDEPAWTGLPTGTDLGHIHLQVSDLRAAERFYTEALGFERMMGMPSASFVSAGGYHHHVGMNTWAGVGVPVPPEDAARLLFYDIYLPTAEALDATVARLQAAGAPLAQGAEAWTVRDPSHNLIRLLHR